IASALNEAIASGDWTAYITGVDRLKKVTPADVMRLANKYLVEDQSTTGYFIPKQAGAQNNDSAKANNYMPENGPFYYRHSDEGHVHEESSSAPTLVKSTAEELISESSLIEKSAS